MAGKETMRVGPIAVALREKRKKEAETDADALDAGIQDLQERAARNPPTLEEIKRVVRTEINSALASAGRG